MICNHFSMSLVSLHLLERGFLRTRYDCYLAPCSNVEIKIDRVRFGPQYPSIKAVRLVGVVMVEGERRFWDCPLSLNDALDLLVSNHKSFFTRWIQVYKQRMRDAGIPQ